jgi:hypothetical protein
MTFQDYSKKMHYVNPIAFACRQLTNVKIYIFHHKTSVSMVFSVKKFQHYLVLNSVVFFVNHMVLKYLTNKLYFSGRVVCWILLLDNFSYTMQYTNK